MIGSKAMPLLKRFDTPGGLRDFPEGQTLEDWLERWHNYIDGLIGPGPFPGSLGPDPNTDPRTFGEFYNQHVLDVNPIGERLLVWMGFPRPLFTRHRDERRRAFELSDTRGATEAGTSTQQEYMEWHVTKDEESGGIRKVTFVTETPEYWKELFDFNPERVLNLYRHLVSPKVEMEHLLDGNNYNPLNRWNTSEGIVHYIVTNLPNTLDAAVGLARGSVGSPTGTRHVRDNYEFENSAFTSADPRLQLDVNTLARKGLSVTGREPIALYMAGWDDTGWAKPDGSPVGNYWRVVRGRPGAALRLEYEVPEDEGFLVSDIKIGGRPVGHGGHLAEHVTVMFGGLAGTRAA
jgi:hypothetical protein